MKKAISLLAVFLLLCSIAASASATGGGGAAVVSGASGAPGDTVSVTVNITSNPGVMFIKITPSYDSEKLELVSLSALSGWTVATSANWDGANDESFTGEVVTMEFKIKEGVEPGSANASVDIWAANHDEELVNFTVTPGAVTITEPAPAYDAELVSMNCAIGDFFVLNLYVKTGVEDPSFDLSLGGTSLNKVDAAGFYTTKNSLCYAEYVSAKGQNALGFSNKRDEDCWMISVKFFLQDLGTPVALTMKDGDRALMIKGYRAQGIGSTEVAASHAYSYLDCLEMLAKKNGGYFQSLHGGLKSAVESLIAIRGN